MRTAVVERFFHFGRHVVFIVFGQHLGCHQLAFGIELTLCNGTFAFGKQVRQHPGVGDRHGVFVVGQRKRQCRAVPRERPRLHQPADAQQCFALGLTGRHLPRREKKHQVAAQRLRHQVRAPGSRQHNGQHDP